MVALVMAPTAVAAGDSRGAALQQLAAQSIEPLEVRRSPRGDDRHFVVGGIPVSRFSPGAAVRDQAKDFWRAYGAAFGVRDPRTELALRSFARDRLGGTHLRYEQRYRGLEVFGRQLVLHVRGDAVVAVNGTIEPGINIGTTPAVSAGPAGWTASLAVPFKNAPRAPRVSGAPDLLVYVHPAGGPRLAWRVTVATSEPLGLWRVFVDARTGEILNFYNDLHTLKNRETYTNANDPDCNSGDFPECVLPGVLRRNEAGCIPGPTCPDAVVNAAHTHTGTVYDYYSTTFGRDSYDDAGHTMRSTVHFGSGYNNAFWCDDDCAADYGSLADGEQMVYGDGDGDGVVFSPLAQDIDVVAHELTHAVTEKTASLIYFAQPGALNESYSDVFAVMVDTDNWLVGEDSFTPGTPGDALRSLENPVAFGQPAHMDDYVHTAYDNSGVHINSGIPNHAAYLTATGPGYGIGRADTEQIYYWALAFCLDPFADFLTNLNCLILAAESLYPGDTTKVRAIERAHAAVGISNPPAVTFPNGAESLAPGSGATVTWDEGGDYNQSFSVAFLRESAPTTYLQGFEGGPPLLSPFTTGGDAPWFVTTQEPRSGSTYSVRSGAITHDQRSELRLVVRVAEDGSAVNSLRRVSSEGDFDFLSFHVDGIPILFSSGALSWSTPALPDWPPQLPAGTHELVWVYEKDFIESDGLDAAFIDNISIENVENVALTTINPSTPAGASSQPWTVPSEEGSNYRIRVRRMGVAPWYAVDDSDGTFAVGSPPPPPAAQDTTPPSLTLAARAVAKLKAVLRKGYAFQAQCSEACTLLAQLRLAPKVAKKLKLPQVVGQALKALQAGQATQVVVKLKAKAKRKFKSVRKVVLQLVTTATDPAGNTRTVKKKVVLRR